MQTTFFFGLTVIIFIYAWPATLQVAIALINIHTKSVHVQYDTKNFTLFEEFRGCYVQLSRHLRIVVNIYKVRTCIRAHLHFLATYSEQ